MNPNSNLKHLLVSQKNDDSEKNITISKRLLYSNNYLNNESVNNSLFQLKEFNNFIKFCKYNNNNIYLCFYSFFEINNEIILKYGLTFSRNFNNTLEFPQIKMNFKPLQNITAPELITRIKTYSEICFKIISSNINHKGIIEYDKNYYFFFEIEQNDTNIYSNITWGSLHEICNLQEIFVNNNTIAEKYHVNHNVAELFFNNSFLVYS